MLTKLQQKVINLWSNLDKSQKTRIYITSAILVVAIATSIFLLTKPNYVKLISNADTKEIGEMTKILDEKNITYTVDDGGTGITINSKDNNIAQATLVQAGYPKGGLTFNDAFNMIKINTTESDKKKLWQEYKVSTLISKLKMFDNVKDADVELALPEKSPFVGADENEQKTTAYVRVTPKAELTPKQVQGITMMVARSVENLDPKDVTVMDNNFNILEAETDENAQQPGNQEEMRLKRKKELEKNVMTMFNGQFDSFDNIRVVANPYLDFNKQTSKSNQITNPEGMDGGALISSQVSKEKLVNGSTGGTPGMDSNPGTLPASSYQTGSSGNSSYDKSNDIKNYDYTRTQVDQEKALGELIPDKSTMAVTLLYGNRVASDTAIDQNLIDQVKGDVSKATGIPVANITVSKYKIAPSQAETKPISDYIKDFVNTYGLFALMLLLVIGLLIAIVPKKKSSEEMETAAALQAATASGGPRFIVPDASSELIPELEMEERSEVKKQIDKFVKQNPEAVASLLRNWLSDEWD